MANKKTVSSNNKNPSRRRKSVNSLYPQTPKNNKDSPSSSNNKKRKSDNINNSGTKSNKTKTNDSSSSKKRKSDNSSNSGTNSKKTKTNAVKKEFVDEKMKKNKDSSSKKTKTNVVKKEEKKEEGYWCHQCRTKKDEVVECSKCGARKYCVTCIHKWYPNVSEDKFAEACPVCCNNCNCKGCLRGCSPEDIEGYSCSEQDKIQYSKHILQNVFQLVTVLNEEQLMEKEIEAKIKGLSISELQLQDAECEVDDDIFCDNCGAYIVDLYRSCKCGYDLCLACSRELRDGHLQEGKGMTCGWKSRKDGSIPCPPKDIEGCDDGTLELKHIMPVNWIANILEKAKKIYRNNKMYDSPETSSVSYLYSINANDIQPQDMPNFQSHWSKGEPIMVRDVLSSSTGLSWEPLVMWRAFRDITLIKNDSDASKVKAIDCLSSSEVTIDLLKFFKGYLEDRLKQTECPQLLKLEDWQPSCVSQGEWPRHFVEFIKYLPFKDYTHPNNGYLNAAVKLPDLSLKPDMGPWMDIGYGDSDTKLRYNKSDTVSILTHTTILEQHEGDPMEGGAYWDVFRRQDISKLEEYLRNHSAELSHGKVVHPMHDRAFYLNMEHKRKLKEDFGIEPWTFNQKLGDAVFIPAGCPYQVRNYTSCTKVELNFISPESLGECIRIQNELRMLPDDHIAKQQKLNIGKMMVYALDQAVAELSSVIDPSEPVNDLQDEFAQVPEILNDMNIDGHTNGWVCDTESENNSQETSSVFGALSPLSDHKVEDIGLWRGNDIGMEAKELLQALEDHYPNTFGELHIRAKPYWLSLLKELHVFIKTFLETSVDELAEEQINSLYEDLNDFERSGFNLSWVRKRLEMVAKLKFGNDPLRLELVTLDKKIAEAHERLKKARVDYDNALISRDKKVQEVGHKFGGDYDRVLKGHLGFGILPGY